VGGEKGNKGSAITPAEVGLMRISCPMRRFHRLDKRRNGWSIEIGRVDRAVMAESQKGNF